MQTRLCENEKRLDLISYLASCTHAVQPPRVVLCTLVPQQQKPENPSTEQTFPNRHNGDFVA